MFAEAANHVALVLGSVTGAVFCLEASGRPASSARMRAPVTRRSRSARCSNLDGPTASVRALRSGTSQSAHYEVSSAGLVDGPELPLRSGAATPIMVDGRVWGVVGVAWPDASAQRPGGAAPARASSPIS